MKKKIKAGYRVLFYGPPGTGKTLTASLLGKTAGLDVYRIDLSMVVSKYIGETEKNLANIFDQAENKNWLLFFDEADALFGKRTQTTSSNDRHANQEVSYLLQRIEDYPGVVILATNLKANLDEAFTRRFQSMIYFPIPDAWQRKKLWKNSFSDKTVLEEKTDLDDISTKYELTGGAIINITRYCSLMAMKRNDNTILLNDVMEGIRREFGKDGKIVGKG
jgi:SpoVK/Ycf46/Vps4 family AAA+-type ATPase